MNSINAQADAALGCLLGLVIGDAAGATLEFRPGKPSLTDVEKALTLPGGGHWRVAPGQITDDGELMISLARALSESSAFNIEQIAVNYAEWVRSRPFDIGNTTRQSLGCFLDDEWRGQIKQEGYAQTMEMVAYQFCFDSKANGSLMRIAPLGVWGHKLSISDLALYAESDARLSHPNSSCCDSAACYVIAIASLINYPGDRKQAFERARDWAEMNANAEVCDWLSDAAENQDVAYTPQQGYVRIAFTHAFRHLLLGSDYLTAIRETLLGGGDTDTNACIVGGLIGAAVGASQLPTTMKDGVINCDTGKGRPRPENLHPKQLPALVEMMLKNAPQ